MSYAYRVDGGSIEDIGRQMRYGTESGELAALRRDQFADYIANNTFTAHSYYRGGIIVFVWEISEDEPLHHYRDPVPAGAYRKRYDSSQPAGVFSDAVSAGLYSDKCDECTTGISCEEAERCLFEG